ncbi:MAG: AbrB/MazE/SpoVT family DNA-binding domain-containing protein [Euryarchaeota archaeon]|nr:AbrB/MazE/SpoVT family DNA-binding domain-containing protein [Euryarchaeota archaeon]
MEEIRLDDRGRVTVPKEYRWIFEGRRVVPILLPDGVLLSPLEGDITAPEDLDALVASGEEEAVREASHRLRRSRGDD